MQRINNYGSFLQAYALKKIIESMGHKVEFVDYVVGKPILLNRTDKISYVKNKYSKKISKLFLKLTPVWTFFPDNIRCSLQHYNNFKSKYFDLLGVSDELNYYPNLDILVIGSDEVFNCTQLNPDVGYSIDLFGANAKSKKIITYAASFGNTTISSLEKARKVEEISILMRKFDAISVRDDNSYNIVRKLVGKSPTINLDPTLIYDFSEELSKEQVFTTNYILVYAYRKRISTEEQLAIKAFARKTNRRLLAIGGYQSFCDENIQCSPFKVLLYFRNADYVITDTFHGTIFAVINERKFVTFVRGGQTHGYGNSEKLLHLLKTLKLQNRIVDNVSDLEKIMKTPIDYHTTNLIIGEEKIKATSYLKESLQVSYT